MKKIYTLLTALAALICAATLTSCDAEWNPAPPPGPGNTFYDSSLTGCYWELWQVNSRPVSPGEMNWLEFLGNGRGWYYYLHNNAPYEEKMTYWCQYSDNYTSDYQINIRYSTGSPSTMNYWFTSGGNYLWMQWYSYGHGTTTYVYRAVSRLPAPF